MRDHHFYIVHFWQPVDQLTTYAWFYFWTFYSVPSVCGPVFMPVPHCYNYCYFVAYFEGRKYDTFGFILLFQDCVGYLGPSVVLYKFLDCFYIFI